MMESALIISNTEKSITYFTEMLSAASINQIVALQSCAEARRRRLEQDFDLIIINAPLRDESGESLSRHFASIGISQVILVVANEHFEAVSAICENDGVLTISKPINKAVFWSALKLARAAQSRLKRMQDENSSLKKKIEDVRIVGRAKCILISHLNMSEQEAHRYIEKQAMDMRTTKRAIAEGILKNYEN
ncbi:ANTAR domain-containing response regulator [Dehalobacterium formicoaceticum]|uniref:ANTAR domain-containing response regulator n=1 Tax=Dehalobacterium formicoaceticum TaxID=51515 RepID=UPI001FA89D8C|nr:ANTAR domain-containing protein [Dehalobacterium formicoaceticum]